MSETLFESRYRISDEVELVFSTPGSDWPIKIVRGEERVALTPKEAFELMKALLHLTGFPRSGGKD